MRYMKAAMFVVLGGMLLSIPLFAGVIAPSLLNDINSSDRGYIPIYISMEEQVAPEVLNNMVAGLSKTERRQQVVSYLRDFAQSKQEPLKRVLENLSSQGKVRDIRSFWIVNAMACEAKPEAIENIANAPGVKAVVSDKKVKMLADAAKKPSPARSSNFWRSYQARADALDAPADTSWGVIWIGAPDVWNLGYKGAGALIAIMDTGIWYYHTDLANRMWHNPGEIPNNGIDDDGNGYIDDYYGYDFAYNDSDPVDGHGHGTHVSGTVAGDGTGGTLTGVAPEAHLMAMKVLDDGGYGQPSDVVESVDYAIMMNADAMSASIGWYQPDTWIRHDYRVAAENARAAGVLWVVAAGNERGYGSPPNLIRTPGDVPPPWHASNPGEEHLADVVTVGATKYYQDVITSFSSPGPVHWQDVAPWYDWTYPPGLVKPDVSAPGEDINSTVMGGGYSGDTWSGTSMATPHVSGLVALMLSKNPSLTPGQIDEILEETALDLGPAGKDNDYGAGRIRALQAIQAVPGGFNHDVSASQILSPVGDVQANQPVTPRVLVKNFGQYTESFNVTFKIFRDGSPVYTDGSYVSNLAPNASDTVTFTPYTPTQGMYTTLAYTELSGDEYPQNDTTTGFFTAKVIGYDFLIWDLDPNRSSGPTVENLLEDLGYAGNYKTLPAYCDSIYLYQSVWVFVGIYPSNYIIESGSPEANALVDYLNNGGKVYMEGGDVWYYDPLYQGGYDFEPLFGLNATDDGSGDLGTVNGEAGTFTEGMSFSYNGENAWIDHIQASASGASNIFENVSPSYYCGVAYETGERRTVASSFEFAGLQDGSYPSTKSHLAEEIMSFFGIITFVPGDANGDGEVTAADLTYLANYLFAGGPAPDPLLAGDANGDCTVDANDLSYLANYLFNGGPPPQHCG